MAAELLVEACVDSLESARIGAAAGVDRIELCANLVEGGTTPSRGSIELAAAELEIPVMVMIRPRGGDFLYSDDELRIMERDIATVKQAGAAGIVFGCLAADGRIDTATTRRLLDAARPLEATFHRAFDVSRDPYESVDALVGIGVDRVLTSGQQASALDGAPLVAELVKRAGESLVVMPGGGIDATNVKRLLAVTGATEIHVYADRSRRSPMEFTNERVAMGRPYEPDEYELIETDGERLAALVDRLRR